MFYSIKICEGIVFYCKLKSILFDRFCWFMGYLFLNYFLNSFVYVCCFFKLEDLVVCSLVKICFIIFFFVWEIIIIGICLFYLYFEVVGMFFL